MPAEQHPAGVADEAGGGQDRRDAVRPDGPAADAGAWAPSAGEPDAAWATDGDGDPAWEPNVGDGSVWDVEEPVASAWDDLAPVAAGWDDAAPVVVVRRGGALPPAVPDDVAPVGAVRRGRKRPPTVPDDAAPVPSGGRGPAPVVDDADPVQALRAVLAARGLGAGPASGPRPARTVEDPPPVASSRQRGRPAAADVEGVDEVDRLDDDHTRSGPGGHRRPGGRGARSGPRGRRAPASEPPGVGAAAVDAEPDRESVARAIVLRQLTAAPRSRQQLAEALARREVPEDVADRVLDRFTEVGLVDDAAYAEMLVRSRHAERGLSRRALALELRRRGVDDDVARAALEQVGDDDEEGAARALARKKLAATRGLDRETRLRRAYGALGRKGYGGSLVARVVREELAAEGAPDEDVPG